MSEHLGPFEQLARVIGPWLEDGGTGGLVRVPFDGAATYERRYEGPGWVATRARYEKEGNAYTFIGYVWRATLPKESA